MHFLVILLFPFTLLYDLITRFRNHLYNIGYKRSFSFETNVISVGNLTVGGTGKTPMVEYIIRALQEKFKLATLSRGYGRKTKGFRIGGHDDTARTIGDEPFQILKKFSDVNVIVCEDRALAIPFILSEKPDTEVILLDDAYQHRSVKPDLNILLTDFNLPFYNDFILPSGRLRESRLGAKRADIIVITKCPDSISESQQKRIIDEVHKYNSEAEIFFTGIRYGDFKSFGTDDQLKDKLIAFSGIAKPDLFVNYLKSHYNLTEHIGFKDHYEYTQKDVSKLVNKLDTGSSLVTTEKDMVKLIKPEFEDLIKGASLFYLPIEAYFIKDGKRFDTLVRNPILKYSN
ncbi:MAG: tetraacyldisaccharide 4'-kinase [Bacteroidota bacterium]